jgi:hypothetical protein
MTENNNEVQVITDAPEEIKQLTDHATPVFSQLIVDFIIMHPQNDVLMEFLMRLGLTLEEARNYLAYLNGNSVTIVEAEIVEVTNDMVTLYRERPTTSINLKARLS